MNLDRAMIESVLAVAMAAGREIMAIYHDESRWQTEQKADDSPLTAADMAAHHCIESSLLQRYPEIPVLSEESEEVALEERQGWSRFWLVDPLDGTKEFIARNNEFTVNIALVEGNEAVLGVVYGPANATAYVAVKGLGAFRVKEGEWTRLQTAPLPVKGQRDIKLCTSRRHRDPREEGFIASVTADMGEVEVVTAGSSFKICAVAEGSADAYPRIVPTMEWDTAAGQVVLEEAGGALLDAQGRPFRYNARASLLNGSFLAFGTDPERWLACWRPVFAPAD